MTFKEIQELIKLVGKSNLTEFKMKEKDFELSMRTKKYHKAVAAQMMPVGQVVAQAPMVVPEAPQASISKTNTKVDEIQSASDDSHLLEIKSPIVGTFYRSSSPEKGPFAKVGDIVDVGSVVCIVEAMKLFNEIESEISGKVVKVLVEDASPVEYDQALFLVDPNG